MLNALYYSSIIYVFVAAFAFLGGVSRNQISDLYAGREPVGVYLLLAVLGLFVVPYVIAEIGRRWLATKKLRPSFLKRAGIDPGHSVPAGWEQLFLQSPVAKARKGLLVRVMLVDGRIVGGFFGEKSLAGYTAHTRDLFIEQRWVFDSEDWFDKPVEGSRGLWISESQIRWMDVYEPDSTAYP